MIGDPIKTKLGAYRHLVIEETSSTNTLCMDYAAAGEEGNLWITANRQTAGKGSRGREWTGKTGNLFASLLLTDPSPKKRLADLTFIAAISVRQAIKSYSMSNNEIKLKWPNDVMLNSKKCSGILLESVTHNDANYVVMGIGINCQHFPANTLHPATSLFAEGIEVSAGALFLSLANAVANNISFWNKGNNFTSIRQKWLDNAYGLGREVSVKIPGQAEQIGHFISIDANGYMLLETKSGETKQVSTADIFFNQDP